MGVRKGCYRLKLNIKLKFANKFQLPTIPQSPNGAGVSAAASVGASASQRCPPDTRTPNTGEPRVCAIPKLCR